MAKGGRSRSPYATHADRNADGCSQIQNERGPDFLRQLSILGLPSVPRGRTFIVTDRSVEHHRWVHGCTHDASAPRRTRFRCLSRAGLMLALRILLPAAVSIVIWGCSSGTASGISMAADSGGDATAEAGGSQSSADSAWLESSIEGSAASDAGHANDVESVDAAIRADCLNAFPGSTCSSNGASCPYAFDADQPGLCVCEGQWQCITTCPPDEPSGSCEDTVQLGTTCVYPDSDSGSIACTCASLTSGHAWECGAPQNVCPTQPPARQPCSVGPNQYGYCVYEVDAGSAIVSCTCGYPLGDAGATWTCNSPGCPSTLPAGDCSGYAGVSCAYGTSTSCECTGNAGNMQWTCDGRVMPECPASDSASPPSSDCSEYLQGVTCYYRPSGSLVIGTCVCGADTPDKWSCQEGGD